MILTYFPLKRNKKSIFVAPLESSVQPIEIPLTDGGEAFWLDSRTVAHAVKTEGSDHLDLYALSVEFTTEGAGALAAPKSPVLIGSFPTSSATNFRYILNAGQLVFSDYVYPDGNLTSVKKDDEAWENRGTSALVYDQPYERHWDTWVLPKKPSLFSVRLYSDPDHKWVLGSDFVNTLEGTKHVRIIIIIIIIYLLSSVLTLAYTCGTIRRHR